jgi:hypothetical protein
MEEQNIKVDLLNNDKYNGPIIEFFQQFPEGLESLSASSPASS